MKKKEKRKENKYFWRFDSFSAHAIPYLYNNIVLSMLYAEMCHKVRKHNAQPGRGVHYAF
jgi:hypothetical protein